MDFKRSRRHTCSSQSKMWGIILYLLDFPTPCVTAMLGTTEQTAKVIISLFMCYPIAIFYTHTKKFVRCGNTYFALAGMDMAFFNYGASSFNITAIVLLIYCTFRLFGPGRLNILFTCTLSMTPLFIGYSVNNSATNNVSWTAPFCVLSLKLIALSLDVWDGQRESTKTKKNAVIKPPTLLELLGFVYFPSCFLVGPIFSFKRYEKYMADKFPLVTDAAIYEKYAMQRLFQGIGYLIAFKVGGNMFKMEYMQSKAFRETTIIYRHFYCGMWGHFALYKYIACWLLAEASCIRSGLTYNGCSKFSRGGSRWDCCTNIKLLSFEGATKFQHYICSFNCNTNYFAADYIHKRLNFGIYFSQLVTILFLTLSYGTDSGYFVSFFNMAIIIYVERNIEALLLRTQVYYIAWATEPARCLMYVLLKLYTIVFMGWILVPFDLKTTSKWWPIYSSLYFSGFVIFLPWPFVYRPVLTFLCRKFNI